MIFGQKMANKFRKSTSFPKRGGGSCISYSVYIGVPCMFHLNEAYADYDGIGIAIACSKSMAIMMELLIASMKINPY